jgi:hypothetical protein
MPVKPRSLVARAIRYSRAVAVPVHVYRYCTDIPRLSAPKRNLGRLRLPVDYPPQYAHCDKREHAQPQRLVELPVEVAGVCVYALLGPSGAKCEGNQNKDSRRRVEELGHGSIAGAVHHSVFPSETIDTRIFRVAFPKRLSKKSDGCR